MAEQETGEIPEKDNQGQEDISAALKKMAEEAEYGSGTPMSKEQAERRDLENSWAVLEKMKGEKRDNPEGVTFSKAESGNEESAKKLAEEIHGFLIGFFGPEETTDVMGLKIGIEKGITDDFIARDVEGKIVAYLQTQNIESVSEDGRHELSMVPFFLARSPDWKGGMIIRDLFANSIDNLLEKSKRESKPVKALIAEAVPEVEKLYNFKGLKRVYEKKRGKTSEIPFEDPPEDESRDGVREHLMIRLLDGRQNISAKELLTLVDALYGAYSRKEYFTPEYLKFLAEQEGEAPGEITQEMADQYRQGYMGIVAEIRAKLAKNLESAQGDLSLMSEKERRKSKK